MEELKNNPVIALFLAIISALVLIAIFQQGNYIRAQEIQNQQLWQKLDRMTALFMEERNLMRADIKDLAKSQLCTDKDIVMVKEKVERLSQYHPINGAGMTERNSK